MRWRGEEREETGGEDQGGEEELDREPDKEVTSKKGSTEIKIHKTQRSPLV